MVNRVTETMEQTPHTTKTNDENTDENLHLMSQSMDKNLTELLHPAIELPCLDKLRPKQEIHEREIERFSYENAPNYRRMHKYVKGRRQYEKERERRRQSRQLNEQGLTQKQIAAKLGVSLRTVKRDWKKLKPYVMGQWRKRINELEEQRRKELFAGVEGLSLAQQSRVLFKRLTEEIARIRTFNLIREYNRHTAKIFINLDNLKDGYPAVSFWPSNPTSQMLMYLHLVFVKDGQQKDMGALQIKAHASS